jgi:UDP-N-acetylmuramoylalanine--D-glutamate ligase
VGYGRSGRAAAAFLRSQGADVSVVDQGDRPELRAALQRDGLSGRLGGYDVEDLHGCDLVVVSPGVPWDGPVLDEARRRGLMVTSEIDLFFRTTTARLCGITGTNGKSTTTAMAADLLRSGGLSVLRGGNIGEPVLDRVLQIGPTDWVVLELSSFQLESIEHPRLRIGAVLNVTPDHLDRHRTFERYRALKARAVRFMEPGDQAVLNQDDPNTAAMAGETHGRVVPFSTLKTGLSNGITVEDGWIRMGSQGVMPAADVPLPGRHNLSNALAAVAIGWSAGVSAEPMARALRQFSGLEHRLELVGQFGGVRWYNDSKATTPDSTVRALEAFAEPIVLIAGGRNKGIELTALAQVIAGRAAALIAIGETGPELADRVRALGMRSTVLAQTMEDAVREAARLARPGSVVLLSPAFASYDMFQDFEDRGRRFKAAVRQEVAA